MTGSVIRGARRALVAAFGIAGGSAAGIATIGALPKSMAYAAPDRLIDTVAVFAIGGLGLAGVMLAQRRYRAASLWARYSGASSAVRDTLSYISSEARLARRGRLPALLGGVSFLALDVLSRWPQLAALAPFTSLFGVSAAGAFAGAVVLAVRNRAHVINGLFLRRYLREQIAHLGYRPARIWRATERAPARLQIEGYGAFSVGGFTWQLPDFYQNVLVCGQIGAGKTTAVLNNLLQGLLGSMRRGGPAPAALIIDAKGEFHRGLRKLCGALGRAGDLVVLDPAAWGAHARTARAIAWNLLDNDDDALEIATRLIAVLRMIGLELGHEGSFFLDSAKTYLRHAITLVRAAAVGDAPSIIDVYRLALETEAATPLYHQLLTAIGARFPETVPEEVMDAIRYFENEFGPMADRQKSGLIGTITQLLDEFQVSPFREMFTGKSTVAIGDLVDQGKILYVHMPIATRERMSRVVSTLIKLEFQRQILLRVGKARPSVFLCDEFQTFYTTGDGRGDSDFLERSRASNHANIVATQNISAFLKRTRNSHDVRNLLGNCATKIFLRNTEEETNRWASALFGERSEVVITTNEQAALAGWSRRRHTSYGRATKMLPAVPPGAFATLAIPVRAEPSQHVAESLMHLGARGQAEHHRVCWPLNPLD